MNDTDLQNLLSECSGFEQRVYDALREHGKMTDRQLRDQLGSPGSGPHDALKKLLPLGLVRHAGKAKSKGNPMQWEATPPAQVEEEQRRYEVRKPLRRPRRTTSPGARLAELRQLQPGDARKWYPQRDKILAALPLLTNTVKMAFWETVPVDELELALDEIEELHEAAGEALAAGRERLTHEKAKAKIDKMQQRNGRTAAENEVVERKVETLSKRLIERDPRC